MTIHQLTHYEMADRTGLTPGCTCGWASPNRSHSEFERHLRRIFERADDDPQTNPRPVA